MKRFSCASSVCLQVVAMAALCGCGPSKPPPSTGLTADVDAACGGPAWRGRRALSADITVSRQARPDLHGQMLYDIPGNRLVLQFPVQGGGLASCGLDSQSMWLDCPFDINYAGWPHVLQWANWVAVPYRLTDTSIRAREVQPVSVAGESYRTVEIERPADGPGVCVLYVTPGALRPRGAVPECPAGVHCDSVPGAYAFAYLSYDLCDDVVVPTRWSVWTWDAQSGVSAAGPVASISLQNLRFVDPDPSLFDVPVGEEIRRLPRAQTPTDETYVAEASHGTR